MVVFKDISAHLEDILATDAVKYKHFLLLFYTCPHYRIEILIVIFPNTAMCIVSASVWF